MFMAIFHILANGMCASIVFQSKVVYQHKSVIEKKEKEEEGTEKKKRGKSCIDLFHIYLQFVLIFLRLLLRNV